MPSNLSQQIIHNEHLKQNIQKSQFVPVNNNFFKNFQMIEKSSNAPSAPKPLKNPKILRDLPVVSKSVVDLRMVYNGDDSVTSMEVGVDPNLFFADDDEETLTSSETHKEIIKEDVVKEKTIKDVKKIIQKPEISKAQEVGKFINKI